jgi:thiamine-monophosphate kinase
MGASPLFVLLALTLPEESVAWATGFARGAAQAAHATGTVIAGGNLTRGPLGVSVSVHGSVPAGQAVLRSGAKPGDRVYVSGALGGAAAALRRGFDDSALAERFYRPRARTDLSLPLRLCASAAIDISDGLLQDLGHLARASGCRMDVEGEKVPVFPGAKLGDALYGGDDYELCFTASAAPSFPAFEIGVVGVGSGVWVDGALPERTGYQHFV